jgi:hypothetical protein
MSTTSFIPAGALHVALLVIAWNVTTIPLAALVVMLGVVCFSADGVACPFWASMLDAVFTPWNVTMQPAEPCDVENVQRWVAGSAAVATRL